MKKFSKFVFATLSVAAFVGGAYYFVKNILNKNSVDDFDEFEDDFDDFDLEEGDDCDSSKEDRGYVTLNFQEDDDSKDEAVTNTTKNESSHEEVSESTPTEENNITKE
ncbi:MAG: hypothetical protein ACERKN_22260 [Velocimicrobium sp.]